MMVGVCGKGAAQENRSKDDTHGLHEKPKIVFEF